MVAKIAQTNVKWVAPSPFWAGPGAYSFDRSSGFAKGSLGGSVGQPAILRFSTDLFMEELLEVTAFQPDRLSEWIAKPETWREPMPTPSAAAELKLMEPIHPIRQSNAERKTRRTHSLPPKVNGAAGMPLKLYQPVQQRHYLVTASLVCQQNGLPDRVVDRSKREKIGFVIRRVFGDDPMGPDRREYAFVRTQDGFAWKYLAGEKRQHIDLGEERLPLFSINYHPCAKGNRQLLAGTIPVGKREVYLAAPRQEDSSDVITPVESSVKQRVGMLFEIQVRAPWAAMLDKINVFEEVFLRATDEGPDEEERIKRLENYQTTLKGIHEQIQTNSWYVLLDFAIYLEKYLNPVWQNLKGELSTQQLNGAERELARVIKNTTLQTGLANSLITSYGSRGYSVASTLGTALVSVMDWETNLETIDIELDLHKNVNSSNPSWPDFLFPLAYPSTKQRGGSTAQRYDLIRSRSLFGILPKISSNQNSANDFYLSPEQKMDRLDQLVTLIKQALPETLEYGPELEPVQVDPDGKPNDAWFVIRCVYERPRCRHKNQVVVSEATEAFQMAAFFDPDAPARPVRIPMPLDISPAGLRKYKKNTTFIISDMLCGQLERIKKMSLGDLVLSVLPWPFHKDLPNVSAGGKCKKGGVDVGMFCSLSIPIVTLCALILMMIMVALFDLFFKWLPLLFVCLPIPGLKGKKP